jgi:hypothetical protein
MGTLADEEMIGATATKHHNLTTRELDAGALFVLKSQGIYYIIINRNTNL